VDLQFVTHFQTAHVPGAVDIEVNLARTASRGSIDLASADPADPPAIDPDYLSAREDVDLAVAGIRLARRLAATTALRMFPLTEEIWPGARLRAEADLARYVRAVADTGYHPVGTCRMGFDGQAVVDDRLRVHGVDGLRVIDASIMPELPNGNTAAPTLMIAEKGADLVADG
jgi:choline dehydrogenase